MIIAEPRAILPAAQPPPRRRAALDLPAELARVELAIQISPVEPAVPVAFARAVLLLPAAPRRCSVATRRRLTRLTL